MPSFFPDNWSPLSTSRDSMKRRKLGNDRSVMINSNEKPLLDSPGKEKEILYDFSRDPKVLMLQGRIRAPLKETPSDSQSSALQRARVANSEESSSQNSNKPTKKQPYERLAQTQQAPVIYKPGKQPAGMCSDFKTASGRPLVKEVLPVVPECATSGAQNDGTRNCLGGRGKIIPMQKTFAPMTKFGIPGPIGQEPSLERTGEAVSNKKEGWKADKLLKNFDDNIINMIETEIMSQREHIQWTDVAGLESVKKILKEVIVLPFLRPDIFTGIRAPPKGVLLFGPPGTGKTMIGRCVAAQCKATFFNISASSIASKWVGEGEKLVRALFTVARVLQPSIIFIDEVDSLLTSRNEQEHESSRRIKTEFLIRPQELDAAVKRRFAKRLYIGLPCNAARAQMVRVLLDDQKHALTDADIESIAKLTEGYSGADMKQLCTEAAMGPVRNIIDSSSLDISSISASDIRSIALSDFEAAVRVVRPTVVPEDLKSYEDWNRHYGSFVFE